MFRIPPVRLLLPHHAGPDFGRLPQPQLEPQPGQQALESGIVPAGLHPHPHLLPGQRTVKLLSLGAVAQPAFFISSRLIVKDRDLLKSRMKITALYLACISPIRCLRASGRQIGFRREAVRSLRRSRSQPGL